jgi:hypothetical protein
LDFIVSKLLICREQETLLLIEKFYQTHWVAVRIHSENFVSLVRRESLFFKASLSRRTLDSSKIFKYFFSVSFFKLSWYENLIKINLQRLKSKFY